MSTNSNCEIIGIGAAKWFYVLEDYNAPKNAWDWREHASAYGPFKSQSEAHDHLRANHANPGGCDTSEHGEGFQPDAVLKKLIEKATT